MDDKDRKIRVGVFANPRRDEGASIRTTNVPFIMRYEVPPGISDNMFSYSVCRTERYTLFMMYCNSKNIWTMDGEDGILNIGVSIEAQYALDKGKSVYDLLQAVFNRVKNAYLSETSDVHGRVRFKFNRTMDLLPQSYFDDVLADYPVMKSRYAYNPMTGSSSAGIELSEERIRALFGNVDYYINRHFLGYSEVIVAPKLNSYFSGKIMPLPKRWVTLVPAAANSYGIIAYYYDENNDRQYLSAAAGNSEVIVEEPDFDRKIIVTSDRNIRCYERGQVSFKVNDVIGLSGRTLQIDGVFYYPDKEKIACAPADKEKIKTFEIDLRTPDSLESIRRSIRLTLDGRDLAVDTDGRFTLTGMQIESVGQPGRILATCDHSRYEIDRTSFLSDGSLCIFLKHKTSNIEQRKSFVPEAKGVKAEFKLKLKISGVDTFRGDKVVAASCGKQSVSRAVGRLSDNSIVSLPLLSDFLNSDNEISISVSDGSVRWEETYNANYIKDCIYQDRCVKVNASEVKSIGTKRSKGGEILGKIIFWSAPILLILLLATGVFAFLQLRDNSRKGAHVQEYERLIEENQRLKEEIESLKDENYRLNNRGASHRSSDESEGIRTVVTGNRESELSKFFANVKERLENNDLTFKEVKDFYDDYNELKCTGEEQKKYSVEISQLKAYYYVVTALTGSDSLKIKALDDQNEYMQKLNTYHKNMVLGIYYGDYTKTPAEYYSEGSTGGKNNKMGRGQGLKFYLREQKKNKYKKFGDLSVFLNNRNMEIQEE